MLCRLCLFLIASAGMIAQPASAQVVNGRVIDDGTRAGLRDVTITVFRGRDIAATVLTDSTGRFRIRLADSAGYRLRAQRIGYAATESALVTLGISGTTQVELRMRVRGIPLEPLMVVGYTGPERGRVAFERRRELGKGVFLTEDSLKLRHIAHPVDALMGVQGISIVYGTSFTPRVTNWMGNHCLVYYVDNYTDQFVIGRGGFNGRSRTLPFWLIDTSEIVAVEVYADGNDVPAELVNTPRLNSRRPLTEQTRRCGVVRIWTRDAW